MDQRDRDIAYLRHLKTKALNNLAYYQNDERRFTERGHLRSDDEN